MALKSLTFECPSCEGAFKQLLDLARGDVLPRFCSLCGFDVGQDRALEQGLPSFHIPKSIKKTVDTMHRDMEAGAQFRADYARAELGMDEDGANQMKMTDMRDGMREGDTSDVPVNNEITKIMADPGIANQVGWQSGPAQGIGYSGAVAQGPFPNAGARAQAALRASHAKFTASAGHAGPTASSLPALETTNPGYRARVG